MSTAETGVCCAADPAHVPADGTLPQPEPQSPRAARGAPRTSGARASRADVTGVGCTARPDGLGAYPGPSSAGPDAETKPGTGEDVEREKGGQSTLRPPQSSGDSSCLKPKALVSGIDSLSLSFIIYWNSSDFLSLLGSLKELAVLTEKTQPLILTSSEGITFFFEVQPTGTSGFAFMVTGKNFKFKFLNSLQPKGLRPSVMVDIASETLWEHGPHKAVEIVFDLLTLKGAEIKSAKPSRVDLCFDIFLPESIWNPSLIDFAVCRAKKHSLYGLGPLLEGITFGKGQVSCRIYDKMLEIERKSKKWWMLPIWKLTEIPSGMKVIRVEFQLRREALKQLGQEDIWDTLIQCPNLWAYCSQNWLKFQDNPGKHPDQRDTFPWWRIIQLNFAGEQYPSPQVRLKANNADQKRLASQALGLVTSLLALEQGFDFEMLEHMTFEDLLAAFERCISLTDKELKTIREDMSPKLGKKRVEPSESGSGPDWQHEKSVLMDSFYRRVSDPDLLEVPHEQTS